MPPNFSDEDLSDVSEDWDSSGDEAVEKKEQEAAKAKAQEEAKTKKGAKKTLQQKIKEREEREKREMEIRELTPEQRRAQLKKEQDESELLGAMEFVDVKDPEDIDISKFAPKSKHDFSLYSEKLGKTISQYSSSPFYVDSVVDLTRVLIQGMKLDDTRKVETMLKVQINKLVKESSGKKGKKKAGKGSLNAGGGKGGMDTRAYDGYDDMEDLM
ncbi:Oidioi.mRNA.OKI2018_I69.chr1.g3876.t1.cds [Oikopleura dioica]|uniref:Oidioi.mRNA.OKI2018_I69.chr1.g3876.t1.cds n=1 Tax=Oikopleura dioica TaxID=34765 RepID=A0ABN7SW20_OIKDI|nr:Oidioi.mRNA.OKI2018_I69.chr1.g3876.t1.cds [Oikopleura dioica]